MRQHRKYGHGLKSLKSPRYWAQVGQRLEADDPMADGQGTDVINGVSINLEDSKSLLLGFVSALQLND
jgi:hypothetical protein